MFDSPIAISFIIPAFNEEAQLGPTLAAIPATLSGETSYEILVVDNGSTDRTAEVASAAGARVIWKEPGTIGSARNAGARGSKGKYLVFLDADVVLGTTWGERVPGVLADLDEHPRSLSGGMCIVPDSGSWIERVWFKPRESSAFSHLGTGHLLTTREFFFELGGFDESLEVGEDYDLSRRAIMAGGSLVPTPQLVAEHHGFPRTMGEFIRREVWHGKSDFLSLQAFLSSKVALLTALFVLAHLVLLVSLVRGYLVGAAAAAAGVVGICAASAWVKYRGNALGLIIINTGLYYVYFFARFLAGVQALLGRLRTPNPG